MIFVGEIEQKQAMWCLKRKSLNQLYIYRTVVKNQYYICNHGYFFEKKNKRDVRTMIFNCSIKVFIATFRPSRQLEKNSLSI